MAASTPLHYILSDMLIELMSKGIHRKTTRETFDGNTYNQVEVNNPSFFLNQEIAIVDLTIYDNLKLSAIKLLIQIQKELKPNNPLWQCEDKHLSEIRSGLAQLKEKDIIKQIGKTDIYIVNPEKIRRGKPMAALASLYQYCKEKWEQNKRWRISNEDIKRLIPPQNVTINAQEIGYGFSMD